MASAPALYVFIDECGDFNFSPTGSPHFILNGVSTKRPFRLTEELSALRFDMIEDGHDMERFHAVGNPKPVRRQVFAVIANRLTDIRIDSIIVRKCRANPVLRPPAIFYPRIIGHLLNYLLSGLDLSEISEVIVITDTIPVLSKKKAIVSGIKQTLPDMLPAGARYRILHHDGRSCGFLQVVDYTGWAIQRKWEMSDTEFYSMIRPAIANEFDLFRRGDVEYY